MDIEIIGSLGEYKEFPYKKQLYIDGKLVWEADFKDNLTAEQVVEEFNKAVLESTKDYEQIYK